jgi:hypothetical protein
MKTDVREEDLINIPNTKKTTTRGGLQTEGLRRKRAGFSGF